MVLTTILSLILLLTLASIIRMATLLFFARRTLKTQRPLISPCSVPLSVVVPCYNEEAVLSRTLAAIFASEGVVIDRVVCVDDGSVDATHAVMVAAQQVYGARLNIVRQVNGGKAAALNAGLSLIVTDYFIAIDADTQTLPWTIAALMSNFGERPDVVAVSGHMLVGNQKPASLDIYSAQVREYERANNLDRLALSTANLTSVVPGAIGAFDTGAVRRAGGYPQATLAEDAHLTFELLLLGGSIVHEPRAIVLTEAPQAFEGLLTQRVRWATGKLQVLLRTGQRALKSSLGVRLLWLDTAFQEGLAPLLNGLLLITGPGLLSLIIVRWIHHDVDDLESVLTLAYLTTSAIHLVISLSANRFAHAADSRLRTEMSLPAAKRTLGSITAIPLARFVATWRAWYCLTLGPSPQWNKLPRSGDVVLGGRSPATPCGGDDDAQRLAGDAILPSRSSPIASHSRQRSPMAREVVRVEALEVTYGEIRAVRDISFTVVGGTALGLLGGNGAGKTTTISTMLGLIVPASGRVEVLGADMAKDRYAVLHRINLSSPYVALPALLTVRQILRFYGNLYNLENVSNRVQALIEDLDLTALARRPFGELSAGQKTRVSLAKALINRPEVLFLDEPTASLDPETGEWVRSLLESYRHETGATIVIASHNMSEVERLCTEVVILSQGTVIEHGTPDQLVSRYDAEDLEAVFLQSTRSQHTVPDRGSGGADSPKRRTTV